MIIKNSLFKKVDPEKAENILNGAVAGVLLGAGIGAIYGGIEANNEISKVPVQTVTLTYKKPIYGIREIGKIPEDKYAPGGIDLNPIPNKPVLGKAPLKDQNGRVMYREIEVSVSGHGTPKVFYDKKPVLERVVESWGSYTKGNVIGYYPITTYVVADEYLEPIGVTFEHGVNVGKYVFNNALKGALIGTVVGGVIGAVLPNLY